MNNRRIQVIQSCEICFRSYEEEQSNAYNAHLYCSRSCEQDAEATCEYCNHLYNKSDSTASNKRTYCSVVCENANLATCCACGNEFEMSKSNAHDMMNYCSVQCENEDQETCSTCGKSYKIHESFATNVNKYCSSECENREESACKHCGKSYKIAESDAYYSSTYCSIHCQQAEGQSHNCIQCYQPYELRQSDAVNRKSYCSATCETKASLTRKSVHNQKPVKEKRSFNFSLPKRLKKPKRQNRKQEMPNQEIPNQEQSQIASEYTAPNQPMQPQAPKFSMRQQSNMRYFYKVKRFIIWMVIFEIIYQYCMKDYMPLRYAFQVDIGKGILFAVLFFINCLFILNAVIKIVFGALLAPVGRFKYYTALIIAVGLMLLAEKLVIGYVVSLDIVMKVLQFV